MCYLFDPPSTNLLVWDHDPLVEQTRQDDQSVALVLHIFSTSSIVFPVMFAASGPLWSTVSRLLVPYIRALCKYLCLQEYELYVIASLEFKSQLEGESVPKAELSDPLRGTNWSSQAKWKVCPKPSSAML